MTVYAYINFKVTVESFLQYGGPVIVLKEHSGSLVGYDSVVYDFS